MIINDLIFDTQVVTYAFEGLKGLGLDLSHCLREIGPYHFIGTFFSLGTEILLRYILLFMELHFRYEMYVDRKGAVPKRRKEATEEQGKD